VALIGSITAIIAALLGIVATDIKRVMAYSTISQLGYMMMGLGVAGMVAAIFHLFTHAFFKALLFLGAGSVNHATGTFDMRKMGGLAKFMPITFGTVLVASLSLIGVFPLAGFWSKDEILADAWEDKPWVFAVAMTAVFLTALYVGRMLILTFAGEYRGGEPAEHGDDHGHTGEPHESPLLMTFPLLVLAGMAIVAGFLNLDDWLGNIIEGWLPPETEELVTKSDFSLWIALSSVGLGFAGLATAWAVYYVRVLDSEKIRAFLQPLPEILENRYYLDALYQNFLVQTVLLGGVAGALSLWDRYVVDGVVNGVAKATAWSSQQMRVAQSGQAQLYGAVMLVGSAAAVVGILVVSGS
jgi:NADH-quinone oxidoreductase subunit L